MCVKGYEIVSKDDCIEVHKDIENEDTKGMFTRLESDMISQVKRCDSNRSQFKTTGNVQNVNKFEAILVQKIDDDKESKSMNHLNVFDSLYIIWTLKTLSNINRDLFIGLDPQCSYLVSSKMT